MKRIKDTHSQRYVQKYFFFRSFVHSISLIASYSQLNQTINKQVYYLDCIQSFMKQTKRLALKEVNIQCMVTVTVEFCYKIEKHTGLETFRTAHSIRIEYMGGKCQWHVFRNGWCASIFWGEIEIQFSLRWKK